jgi:hypothetical protein
MTKSPKQMNVGDVGFAWLRSVWTPARILAIHRTGTLSVTDTSRYDSALSDWHSLGPQDWAAQPHDVQPQWHPLWWNQVRMGGSTFEGMHDIGVSQAAVALNLAEIRNQSAANEIRAFEANHSLQLPQQLHNLGCRSDFALRFSQAHCNAPSWLPVKEWRVRRGLRAQGLCGDIGVDIVHPHQGEHHWMLVFDGGDSTGVVHFADPEVDSLIRPTAPSLSYWIWDLVRSNSDWIQGIKARKPRSQSITESN